mmetsp:Transcript_25942/g.86384  ORF Transcript_25942/g.86384 Transcript_25942/m.86384 type:complete len:208 (-) Transcript_25942:709-1332(-)
MHPRQKYQAAPRRLYSPWTLPRRRIYRRRRPIARWCCHTPPRAQRRAARPSRRPSRPRWHAWSPSRAPAQGPPRQQRQRPRRLPARGPPLRARRSQARKPRQAARPPFRVPARQPRQRRQKAQRYLCQKFPVRTSAREPRRHCHRHPRGSWIRRLLAPQGRQLRQQHSQQEYWRRAPLKDSPWSASWHILCRRRQLHQGPHPRSHRA